MTHRDPPTIGPFMKGIGFVLVAATAIVVVQLGEALRTPGVTLSDSVVKWVVILVGILVFALALVVRGPATERLLRLAAEKWPWTKYGSPPNGGSSS